MRIIERNKTPAFATLGGLGRGDIFRFADTKDGAICMVVQSIHEKAQAHDYFSYVNLADGWLATKREAEEAINRPVIRARGSIELDLTW